MLGVAGVSEVHDLHVWEVTSGFPALSAHVLVGASDDCHRARLRAGRGAARPVRDRSHDPAGRPRGWGPAEHRGALSVIRGTDAAMRPIVLAVAVLALLRRARRGADHRHDAARLRRRHRHRHVDARHRRLLGDGLAAGSDLRPRPHGDEPPDRFRVARRPGTRRGGCRHRHARVVGLARARDPPRPPGASALPRGADAGDPRAQRRDFGRAARRDRRGRRGPAGRPGLRVRRPVRRAPARHPRRAGRRAQARPTTPRRPRGCGSRACAR